MAIPLRHFSGAGLDLSVVVQLEHGLFRAIGTWASKNTTQQLRIDERYPREISPRDSFVHRNSLEIRRGPGVFTSCE